MKTMIQTIQPSEKDVNTFFDKTYMKNMYCIILNNYI